MSDARVDPGGKRRAGWGEEAKPLRHTSRRALPHRRWEKVAGARQLSLLPATAGAATEATAAEPGTARFVPPSLQPSRRHLGSTFPALTRRDSHPPQHRAGGTPSSITHRGSGWSLSPLQKAPDPAVASAERKGRCDYPRRLPWPASSAVPGGSARATGREGWGD